MTKPSAPQASGALRDFLRELLRKLERFSQGVLFLQQQVVDELIESKSLAVQRFVQTFGTNEVFLVVRAFWHPRFHKHLEPEPPQESILCTFGQVEDNVIGQAGLDTFTQWATQEKGLSLENAADRSIDPKVGREVNDLDDIVAAILYFHRNPPGLKPLAKSPLLRVDMRQAADGLIQEGFVKKFLGGAPATISDTLAQLGLRRVHLYVMYHSKAMASLYHGRPLRLDLNTSSPQTICVNEPGMYLVGEDSYRHPTRSSYIFAYKEGHTIQAAGQSFTARQDDRVIFRVCHYVGDHQEHWNQVHVKLLQGGQSTPWFLGPVVESDEWPFSPGFVRWKVDNHGLWIEYLDKPSIEQIRDYDYIILNAPTFNAFSQRTGHPLDYMGTESLRQQLEWIAQGPAKLHLEISGGADPAYDRIQLLAQAVRGLIHSVGINHGELFQVTNLPDYSPPVNVTGGTSGTFQQYEGIYHRYERALRLAQELDLERLYVHGNDVDLILRRGGSPGDMRSEILADLFAKGIVVLAVLQRTVGDWHGYLQADHAIAGAKDIIGEAETDLEEIIQQGSLSSQDKRRLRGAITRASKSLMTAEVAFHAENFDEAEREADRARATIERTLGIMAGPGGATISLSPVLLTKGFQALIEFAYDFARFRLDCKDPSSDSGLTEAGKVIFQQITETGYHVTPDSAEYSVAVVPVMWPGLPIELNPTGAGDICSGVSAVYSGF